jgi:hypothetical protein
MKRFFLEVLYGFGLTGALALLPPMALLAMPAGGLFLLLVPIWSVGVVCVLFFRNLRRGRIPSAIGVALFAIAVALSPVGQAVRAWINDIDKNAKDSAQRSADVERRFKECATTGYAPLKKPSARHDLVVFKNIDRCGGQSYEIADTVAVLTGMRVIEIGRFCWDNYFPSSEAWETTAEHSGSCVGENYSAQVRPTPSLVPSSTAPLAVGVCLRRTKIPDHSGDRTPAIILRSIPGCRSTEVVERTESGDVELGRVHYDSVHKRYYPDLAVPEGIPKNNWLYVLLSEVLQQDLSDKALMKHAVTTTK